MTKFDNLTLNSFLFICFGFICFLIAMFHIILVYIKLALEFLNQDSSISAKYTLLQYFRIFLCFYLFSLLVSRDYKNIITSTVIKCDLKICFRNFVCVDNFSYCNQSSIITNVCFLTNN